MTTITKTYYGIKTTYNRSKIMTLAHQIKRELGCSMSIAMQQAWKAAKAAKEKAVYAATYIDDTVTVDVTFWAKYGKVRGYMDAIKSNPRDRKSHGWYSCRAFVDFAS